MLARPEPGTREHMLLWLSSQNPDERYEWENTCRCACGRYAREAMGKPNWWWGEQASRMLDGSVGQAFFTLNSLAAIHPRTYGALHDRARRVWSA
jgi:hypothetical protein